MAITPSFTGSMATDIANLLQEFSSDIVVSNANITTTANLTAANLILTSEGNINNVNRLNSKSINVTADADISGKLTVGGNLAVVGNVSIQSNIIVQGNTTLGDASKVHITGGSANQVLTTNGNGTLSWSTVTSSSTATTIAGTNVTGQVANALVAGTVYTAAQPNITSVGTLTGLSVSGNTTLGDVGNVRITGGNANQVLTTNGNGTLSWSTVTASGNATTIDGANVTGTVANATYAGTAGTVTTASQPNITSLGTLTSLAVTGNVTAGNVGGANLVSANFVTGTLTTAAQPNITSVGNLTGLSISGNIIPTANITYDLGNTTHRFKDLWISNSTIHMGNSSLGLDVDGNLIFTAPSGNTSISTVLVTGNGVSGMGPKGDTGADAYQVAVTNGFTGTQQQWLDSLVGPTGNAAAITGWTIDASNNFVPNTDNLQDIGTSTMRVRHIYVGPGSVTIGNSVITESTTGKLVLPGVTRATTLFANEVEDTGDQTLTWPAGPYLLDAYNFGVSSGNITPPQGYSPADYDHEGIDSDGYINGISVYTPGVWTQAIADYNRTNNMYAYTGDNIQEQPFNPSNWVQIPFSVRAKANDVEYEFSSGGGVDALGQITDVNLSDLQDGQALVWDDGDEVWKNQTLNIGGTGGVVERTVSFPAGAIGDTAGTLALTPDGNVYICTTDWVDYSEYGGTFADLETSENYLAGQSGFVFNMATVRRASVPEELLYIIQNAPHFAEDWQITMDDEEFGGPQTCTNVTLSVDGNPQFTWSYRNGTDPIGFDQGSVFSITYTGEAPPQPDIWEQINLGNPLGELTVQNDNQIRNDGGDVRLSANDDIRLDAFDDITLRSSGPSGSVEIVTNFDEENENKWAFSNSGNLIFPDGSIQTTAYTTPLVISATAPNQGGLWFNTVEARLYTKYNDQWVDASPTVLPPPENNPTHESVTFNDASVQTTAWKGTISYNDLTNKPTFVGGGAASTWLTAE